jgi:sugar lactone lactonase YvrE
VRAQLNQPSALAVDARGSLFICDTQNHRIRKVDMSTGIVTTVAGTGVAGFSGDGGPAVKAQFNYPGGLAVDARGNLFVSDTWNHRVRRIDASTGIVTTVAGTGVAGFSGDGGPAVKAQFNYPLGLAIDTSGNLFVAESAGQRVRKITAGGAIATTVAGTGVYGFSGDGGPATPAQLRSPTAVVVDASGNLFIADQVNNRIRKVTAGTGIITTIAGGAQ